MAKGFEDTTFYVFNRLLSLNEVGGQPGRLGETLRDFHKFIKRRRYSNPYSMNAGSTHDTKRGEDVRARINVLSEIPQEWEIKIRIWHKLNLAKKIKVNGAKAPDKNDEYFIYQMLVGCFPFFDHELDEYTRRLKDYVMKAIREAKVHTAWLKPDTAYEEASTYFIEKLLSDSQGENLFMRSFRPFQQKIAHYGVLNSLSQTLIKIACPGVPDFYQGTELWDLNLVDPDNRRPVDFERRDQMLQEIVSEGEENILALVQDLLSRKEDGRLKLFLVHRSLKARKENVELFQEGDYLPLEVQGEFKGHVLAFARVHSGRVAISISPRLMTALVAEGELPMGREVWRDTRLVIPDQYPVHWRNAITSREIESKGTVEIGEILEDFPVALLIGQD